MKLNSIIEGISLVILVFGLIFSFLFFYSYPLKGFNLNQNMKDYSIRFYFLLLFLLILYIFILPLIVVNIVNSDKFITFKNEFINKCINNTDPCFMNMDDSNSESNVRNNEESIITIKDNTSGNKITVPYINPVQLNISNNNSNNIIEVVNVTRENSSENNFIHSDNVVINNIPNSELLQNRTNSSQSLDLSNFPTDT